MTTAQANSRLDKYCNNAMYSLMTWTVSVLNQVVEREIEALPKDMQAKLLRIIGMID